MARYRRYRRTIIRAPKKKWASNVNSFSLSTSPANGSAQYAHRVLVTNAVQSSNPTPVIVKAGNFKVQGDAYVSAQNAGNFAISLYIVYQPEGVVITDAVSASAIIENHPEWIMGWKFVSCNRISSSSGGTDNSDSFTFSSRLKRNLNSGDSISLICLSSGTGTSLNNAYINGMCQFWTCAN